MLSKTNIKTKIDRGRDGKGRGSKGVHSITFEFARPDNRVTSTPLPVPSFRVFKRNAEFAYCELLMNLAEGKVAKAAELAGTDRSSFYALMYRCGFRRKSGRALSLGARL